MVSRPSMSIFASGLIFVDSSRFLLNTSGEDKRLSVADSITSSSDQVYKFDSHYPNLFVSTANDAFKSNSTSQNDNGTNPLPGLFLFVSIIVLTFLFFVFGVGFVIRLLRQTNSSRPQMRTNSVFGTLKMEVISPNRRRKLKVPTIRVFDEDGFSVSKHSC